MSADFETSASRISKLWLLPLQMGWYLQTVKMFEQNVFILSYSQNIFPSIPSENSFLLPVTNEAGTYDFQQNQRLVYDRFTV